MIDNTGRSPLHWAIYFGDTDAVQSLLEHGADIALAGTDGNTALHRCFDSCETTKLILESEQAFLDKGLCNRRNKYGGCPWHFCDEGDILRLHIQHGCDLSVCNVSGRSALHLAMDSRRDISYSEALMVPEVAKIDLALKDQYGWTAHKFFDDEFPTDEDKASPEGMARWNLLQYVERLQNGRRDVVVWEEEESDIESCDDESDDGESYDEQCNGDESSGDDSDEDIFEDAIDHS